MTKNDLREICEAFRDGFLEGRPSNGMCAALSWGLHGFLSYVCQFQTFVYESEVGEWNHIYLQAPNGWVIDVTADQFNDEDRNFPKVHIGEPLDIHDGQLWLDSHVGKHRMG